MQNKRKSLEFTVYLVFKFITFVYAQPELVVSGSAATDFDFPNTQEGIVVIIIFRKKDVQGAYAFFGRLRTPPPK